MRYRRAVPRRDRHRKARAGDRDLHDRAADGIPPALLHNLKANLVLHEHAVLLTGKTALPPTVANNQD